MNDTVKTRLELRNQRIEEIGKAAEEARKDELGEIEDVVPEPEPEPEPEVKTPEPPPGETAPEPKKFKVKIHGKEKEVTEAELIAGFQKNEAADENLRSSAEALQLAADNSQKAPSTDELTDEEIKALARAIQMGSEDEAAQAVKKLLVKPSKQQDVSQVVEERLSRRDAIAEKVKFEDEYKELFKDPYLKRLVYDRDQELSQSEPDTSYTERWRKAAKEVESWAKTVKGSNALQDKAARKASVTPIPSASGRNTPVKDEEADDSPENVIAEMAKARLGRSIT